MTLREWFMSKWGIAKLYFSSGVNARRRWNAKRSQKKG
jgi:hypothetical protein